MLAVTVVQFGLRGQVTGFGAATSAGDIDPAAPDIWVLLLDGDGQHPPAAIPEMLEKAEEHDMVVGSRGGSGGARGITGAITGSSKIGEASTGMGSDPPQLSQLV